METFAALFDENQPVEAPAQQMARRLASAYSEAAAILLAHALERSPGQAITILDLASDSFPRFTNLQAIPLGPVDREAEVLGAGGRLAREHGVGLTIYWPHAASSG